MISRRGLLAGLMAGAAVPAWAEAPATSPRPMARGGAAPAVAAKAPQAAGDASGLVAAAKLGGALGYVVADARTGAVLEALNPGLAQPPASVAKTVTSLFALERLGAGYRFRTRVLATGPVVGGLVQGDLVLAGAGDPTLQTDQLGDLAAMLARTGLRGVTGRYLAYDGALPDVPFIAADQPEYVGYNPAIAGLNLNFNRVHFEWKRASGGGWGVSMDARGERFVPPVGTARVQVVDRERPLFTYRASGDRDDWTVASAALGKAGSRWLPVRNPAVYAAEVFQTLARAQGIDLPDARVVRDLPAGTELAGMPSAPLPETLREMLKFSTNLTAEVMGLTASGQGRLAASGAEMTAWARARFGITANFVDHSGLGAASRISAGDLVRILVAAEAASAGLKPILREIGMRDDAGKTIKNHPVRVLAKSGTLNFVSGLAGHIVPPAGRELTFAIFASDVPRRDALPMEVREQPPGGKAWLQRARTLQGRLISRWAGLYA